MGKVEDEYIAKLRARCESGLMSWQKRWDAGERYEPPKPKKERKPGSCPPEWEEQRDLVKMLRESGLHTMKLTNESMGKRDFKQLAALHGQGMTNGTPDLILVEFAQDGHPVAIEMKAFMEVPLTSKNASTAQCGPMDGIVS